MPGIFKSVLSSAFHPALSSVLTVDSSAYYHLNGIDQYFDLGSTFTPKSGVVRVNCTVDLTIQQNASAGLFAGASNQFRILPGTASTPGALQFIYTDDSDTVQYRTFNTNPAVDGINEIEFEFDNTAKTITTVVNGVSETLSIIGVYSGFDVTHFGANSAANLDFFTGAIYDIRIEDVYAAQGVDVLFGNGVDQYVDLGLHTMSGDFNLEFNHIFDSSSSNRPFGVTAYTLFRYLLTTDGRSHFYNDLGLALSINNRYSDGEARNVRLDKINSVVYVRLNGLLVGSFSSTTPWQLQLLYCHRGDLFGVGATSNFRLEYDGSSFTYPLTAETMQDNGNGTLTALEKNGGQSATVYNASLSDLITQPHLDLSYAANDGSGSTIANQSAVGSGADITIVNYTPAGWQ